MIICEHQQARQAALITIATVVLRAAEATHRTNEIVTCLLWKMLMTATNLLKCTDSPPFHSLVSSLSLSLSLPLSLFITVFYHALIKSPHKIKCHKGRKDCHSGVILIQRAANSPTQHPRTSTFTHTHNKNLRMPKEKKSSKQNKQQRTSQQPQTPQQLQQLVDQAETLFDRKRYSEAIVLFAPAAKQGHPKAQYFLAWCYQVCARVRVRVVRYACVSATTVTLSFLESPSCACVRCVRVRGASVMSFLCKMQTNTPRS